MTNRQGKVNMGVVSYFLIFRNLRVKGDSTICMDMSVEV